MARGSSFGLDRAAGLLCLPPDLFFSRSHVVTNHFSQGLVRQSFCNCHPDLSAKYDLRCAWCLFLPPRARVGNWSSIYLADKGPNHTGTCSECSALCTVHSCQKTEAAQHLSSPDSLRTIGTKRTTRSCVVECSGTI